MVLMIALVANNFAFLMFVDSAQAASAQGLYLKWVRDVGVSTFVGPLAADLIPEPSGSLRVLEIVVTGVSQVNSGFTNGTVTVLNGTDGNVLWTAQPGDILDHSPIEIGDLNKDGIPEIVVSNMRSTSALYGNGSLYWRNDAAPSYDVYSAIADVNQDGYPEVFVSSGEAPYVGVDYITELSYDGQILHQSNTSWHPCWGGVALGDPNFDGNFILLQGDRSSYYNVSSDPYKGGGWGVRALDAKTLTPLWNDSQIICSSYIPMFADVDGDGMLDVVVAWQDTGLAVYNALNGSVLTSGDIYRKTANLGLSSHSQPTIYDIDGDGHPEIITCHNSNPKIFDLYTWSLDATLNIVSAEPPKMGRVTADPTQMNIIAVEGNSVHVYNQQYQEVGNATGLDYPNQFALVADVDGDGYNELILSSSTGKIYCYGTPALQSTPPPRSNVAFYSEYRRGVAEFVEPPGPSPPLIAAPSPADGATSILPTLSSLFFNLTDVQGDLMNYTVTTSPNIGTGEGTNVYNGVFNVSVNGLQNSTTYSWQVIATDGTYTRVSTFTFTTTGSLNTAPDISDPSPANGSTGVPVTLTHLSFTLTDAQNDLMNYAVTTSPDVGTGSDTNVTNKICTISVDGLQYSTVYTWQVNATDGLLNNSAVFTFTTEPSPPLNNPPDVTLPVPSDGTVGVSLVQSHLFFSLSDADDDFMNYTVLTSPNIGSGSGTNVAGGGYNVSISGLSYSTTYSWMVSATDGKEWTNKTFYFTTAAGFDLIAASVNVLDNGCSIYCNDTNAYGNAYFCPVEVVVQNTGIDATGSFFVRLEVYWTNGSLLEASGEIFVSSLGPGATTTVNFTSIFHPTHTDTYRLNVTVDSHNDVTEGDEMNNTLEKPDITVTVVGDTNGDGVVNLFDAGALIVAWDATQSSSNWNMKVDMNHDGAINIFDAIGLSIHWGQTA